MAYPASHARYRATLARRSVARLGAWGLFFLLVSLPFIYRVFAR